MHLLSVLFYERYGTRQFSTFSLPSSFPSLRTLLCLLESKLLALIVDSLRQAAESLRRLVLEINDREANTDVGALPSRGIESLPRNSDDALRERLIPDELVAILDPSGAKVDPEEHARNRGDPSGQVAEVFPRRSLKLVAALAVKVAHGARVREEALDAPSFQKRVSDSLRQCRGVQVRTRRVNINGVQDILWPSGKAESDTSAEELGERVEAHNVPALREDLGFELEVGWNEGRGEVVVRVVWLSALSHSLPEAARVRRATLTLHHQQIVLLHNLEHVELALG